VSKNITLFGIFPSSWSVFDFSKVVFFQEGPGLRNWQWTNEGMKVINVTNILQDGSIDVNNTDRYISINEFRERYTHFAVELNDIVIASSGNTYGKIGRVRFNHLPLMMNTSVVRFHSADKKILDDDYLYSFLRSHLFMNQVEMFVVGSAQPNFGPIHLKQMKIPLPPLETQRKIAAVLSAYDDLIENNTRRIKLLEEAAQSLYREWFVEFRFPGCEDVLLVESDMGIIPEGWEIIPLGEILRLEYGKGLRKDERVFGEYPVYGSSGVIDTHSQYIVDGPGIIVGRKGNVGAIFWSETPFYPIDTTYYVATDFSLYYMYYNLLNQTFIDTHVAVPGLSRDMAYSVDFVKPTSDLIHKFDKFIAENFDEQHILRQKNQILREVQNRLLPRLVSGEVDVSELEVL
jgi:type I restriction enzyme, S subunit